MSDTNTDDPISQEHERERGAFFIEKDGRRIAELTYVLADGVADLDHTEVDDSLRGRGVGARLVEAAVQWAQEKDMKLLPTCPYAKAIFDRTPAYADVRQTP